jgi:hypothetical protein
VQVPTTAHEDATLKVLTADILLGVRWYDVPKFDSLQRFRELQSRYFAGLSGKGIIVSVSDASGELHFDSGSRDLVAALVTDAKSHLLGMAQIVIGDGFGAASVRSVLAGIQLVARPDYPLRFFADVTSARPWIEELLEAASRTDLAGMMLLEMLANLEEAPRAPIP